MYIFRSSALLTLLLIFQVMASGQELKTGTFRMQSPVNPADPGYGIIQLEAGKRTLIIQSILAYGENVKGLSIRINKGFPFKLAPSQTGSTLNYVGTSLHLVLQPGDQATVSFVQSGNQSAANRQLYLSGETID